MPDQICPIRAAAHQFPATARCYRGDCAWWDAVSGKCAVLLVATRLDAVTSSDDTLRITVEPQEASHD